MASKSLKPVSPEDKQALDIYLAPGPNPAGGRSNLAAAMGDASAALTKHHVLWLGALGYLIALESVGGTVARPGTSFTDRKLYTQRFIAGALEFATQPLPRKDARALYGLRSTLVHRFDLTSEIEDPLPSNRKARKRLYYASSSMTAPARD